MHKGWFRMVLLAGCALSLAGVFAERAAAQIESDQLLGSLKYEAFVNDRAGVFTPEERGALEQQLAAFKTNTGPELAVLILPSLQGGEINDFANRLFAQWELGLKGKDDGFLLLVAVEERTLRMEVGYGLEGVLTDAACGRIRDEFITPAFKEGKMAQGVIAGMQAVMETLTRAAAEGPLTSEPPKEVTAGDGVKALLFLVILVVVFVILIVLGRKYGKNTGGSTSSGARSSSGRSSSGSSSSGSSGHSGGGGRSGGGGASGSW